MINSGSVKDNLIKTCCGIGSIGYIKTKDFPKEYNIWRNIIYRCYCKDDKSYKYYGEKGITLCERWKRFDYFCEDIKKIKGFDPILFKEGKIKFDKDILSKDFKIYSPETTCWVSEKENQNQRALEHNLKNKKYAIFPDGHKELITNVSDFCKKYGLNRRSVYSCLSGEKKTVNNFSFYKEQ